MTDPACRSFARNNRPATHATPCGCYVEGYAVGIAEATAKRQAGALAEIEKLQRGLDHVKQAAAEAAGTRL